MFACSLLVVACDLLIAPCYGRSLVTFNININIKISTVGTTPCINPFHHVLCYTIREIPPARNEFATKQSLPLSTAQCVFTVTWDSVQRKAFQKITDTAPHLPVPVPNDNTGYPSLHYILKSLSVWWVPSRQVGCATKFVFARSPTASGYTCARCYNLHH
jgi:hypothetical protein